MDSKTIAVKALIQASMFGTVILFMLLLMNGYEVFLLVFAGILFCVLLRGMTDWLSGKLGTPDGISLALAVILPLLLIAGAVWLAAPEVAGQANQLADRLPQAMQELQKQLMQYAWAEQLWQHKERLSSVVSNGSSGAELITRFFTTSFGLLGNIVIIFFLGLFLALTPDWYVKGTVRLFPVHRREQVHGVLRSTGLTLRNWLIAKLTTMALVGVLTALGLWMLGIDLALVLGVIAALLSFIPNFGPIASAIPAVLIGLSYSPQMALYVVLLYVAIQTVESYLITPLLQKHMIQLPPALLLTMQVLLGVLAGIMGLILSVPLTAAAMVIVRKGYVEGMLEQGSEPAAAH